MAGLERSLDELCEAICHKPPPRRRAASRNGSGSSPKREEVGAR
jgi:hypothetical protein